MKERSDWMEGVLWAENEINSEAYLDDKEYSAIKLRERLAKSKSYSDSFIKGGLDYLEHLEERLC